jgi:hypothetical protein
LLPHGKQYRSTKSRSKKLLNSFYPQAWTLIKWLPRLFALPPPSMLLLLSVII